MSASTSNRRSLRRRHLATKFLPKKFLDLSSQFTFTRTVMPSKRWTMLSTVQSFTFIWVVYFWVFLHQHQAKTLGCDIILFAVRKSSRVVGISKGEGVFLGIFEGIIRGKKCHIYPTYPLTRQHTWNTYHFRDTTPHNIINTRSAPSQHQMEWSYFIE